MSRCFPYPPPGYCRNGATTYEALIESIKLQKETFKGDKSKSERKKEKREKKEKKERKKEKKEKRKDGEKNEFYLNSQVGGIEKTEPETVAEPRTEQLEKSDLTEEHCQPISSQKPSYSSDSTQNSKKRKQDDFLLPDGSSCHAKQIKIRLLRKHKPDSSNEVLCTNSGRSDLPVADARLNRNRTTTSGIENHDPHKLLLNQSKGSPFFSEKPAMKSDNLQGLVFGRKPISCSRPSSNVNKTEAPVLSRSKKSGEPISSSGRPIGTRFEKKKEESITVIPKKCTRHEKKMQKKHSKYEKVMGSWVPLVVEAQLPPVEEEGDWLSRKGPKIVSRDDDDDVETIPVAWQQPCARFLTDLHLYALPYTVPF